MTDYSRNEYHERRHPELLQSRELRLAWGAFASKTYFDMLRPEMSVLEFGGGLGNNLTHIAHEADVWMVEPSPLGRKIASAEGIKSVATLAEIAGRRFDVILCRHVLEHLESPCETLVELRRFLREDGELVVVVPCEHWGDMPPDEELDHHLYCWSARTLTNLLRRAGYRVLESRFEYYGARRLLLPIYRRCGPATYAYLVRLVGRLFRFRELLLKAELDVTAAAETD